jgi:hypothetical protein
VSWPLSNTSEGGCGRSFPSSPLRTCRGRVVRNSRHKHSHVHGFRRLASVTDGIQHLTELPFPMIFLDMSLTRG